MDHWHHHRHRPAVPALERVEHRTDWVKVVRTPKELVVPWELVEHRRDWEKLGVPPVVEQLVVEHRTQQRDRSSVLQVPEQGAYHMHHHQRDRMKREEHLRVHIRRAFPSYRTWTEHVAAAAFVGMAVEEEAVVVAAVDAAAVVRNKIRHREAVHRTVRSCPFPWVVVVAAEAEQADRILPWPWEANS